MAGLEQDIIEHISQPGYKPVKAPALARKMQIVKGRMSEYRRALDGLIESGRVREGKKGRIRMKSRPGTVAGIIKRTAAGAGFVIPHETDGTRVQGDIFIAPEDVRDAHTGDEVLVQLSKRRRSGGQRCGRVEAVLVRATNRFVGTYFQKEGQGYVQVDGNTFHDAVLVGDHGAKDAQPDDKVVIEMLRFPMPFRRGEAVLIEVLGPRGQPGVDTLSIIHEFGLPHKYPDEALEEARNEADAFDEADLNGRRDLTRETIVTIDPVDARDFDDAISLDRSQDGNWHLGVHIADVSHFVPQGGPLDREARHRGNSVYLPTRVVPMLPELISNGLASLQKGKVRYARSIFLEFTADGTFVSSDFANSAIKVTRRFAYEEVLPILRDPGRFKTRVSAKVRALLAKMHELAMILRTRRLQAGMLELSLPEVKLVFDRQGRVTGAQKVEHDESHQIIEEFMIAANQAVAVALAERDVGFLRRTHKSPDVAKLRAFSDFAGELGFPLKSAQSRQELQAVLERVRGQPLEYAIHYALLRSLKQAEYSELEGGHYALAIDDYCHFTSPIRRYPDLVVHRILDAVFSGKRRSREMHSLELKKLAKHCSATERRAEKAERELTKVKLLDYMSERIGEELDAIITGVERFGLFCQGIEIPVEGLVHVSALDPDDDFYYDAKTYSLIGRRSGREYRLGDQVRVHVAHVDVDARVLDFRMVPAKKGRRGTKSARGRSRAATAKKRKRTSSRKQARARKTGRRAGGKRERASGSRRKKR